MSAIFNRNPYAPRNRFLPRQSTVVMFGGAFIAGIACTIALSHYAPNKTAPNPWGPEAAKPTQVRQSAVNRPAVSQPAPVGQPAAVRQPAAPAAKAAAPVRMIAADKVTPAPRADDRNVGVIVARDDSEDTKSQPARSAPPPRLNDYEREALAKAAAAKANAELAGGPANAIAVPAASAPLANVATAPADDEAKRAHDAAEKARKAKARKAARERQLARARQEQWRGQDYRYYGYPNRNQMFAQEYSYGRQSVPYFRPGGIW